MTDFEVFQQCYDAAIPLDLNTLIDDNSHYLSQFTMNERKWICDRFPYILMRCAVERYDDETACRLVDSETRYNLREEHLQILRNKRFYRTLKAMGVDC